MNTTLLTVRIESESDVVVVRQRARQIAGALNFDVQNQTRIATAASEIARNAFTYGGGGNARFFLENRRGPAMLMIEISDAGAGIVDLESGLRGELSSARGMGLGIVGARRLMDYFDIRSSEQGTTVLLGKQMPGGQALTAKALMRLAGELAGSPHSVLEAVQQQNKELLRTLNELQQRQEELRQLNDELEDTNRGVLALYAELDERAQRLRQADEIKSRFLSNMSHEFRTPLNSIMALSRLLLARADGDLTVEQEKQVNFIRKAAENLTEIVNDLLDLAKVEAGKISVYPQPFTVVDLFSALRGMMRPLLTNPAVELVFEESRDLPALLTDEGKVSQILRNLIANALKFTEKGKVQVAASLAPQGEAVVFSVTDTGIGIAPENHERIFHEFGQLDHPIQQQVKGTGLGLPLSRKLANLLGGSLTVASNLGEGATFYVVIPIVYPHMPAETAAQPQRHRPSSFRSKKILIIDNDEIDRYVLQNLLAQSDYRLIEASDGMEGVRTAWQEDPDVIFLDLMMPGINGFQVLQQLKANATTQHIPVVVFTSKELEVEERRFLETQMVSVLSKALATPDQVLTHIQAALGDADMR